MPCKKSINIYELRKKLMNKVRKQYPKYKLERRRKIVSSILYKKLIGKKRSKS